jgi:hypothetical protein
LKNSLNYFRSLSIILNDLLILIRQKDWKGSQITFCEESQPQLNLWQNFIWPNC